MSDLQTIAGEVRKLSTNSFKEKLRVAELLLQAKERFFASDSDGWVDWCKKETPYRRRYAFCLKKVAELVRLCETAAFDISAACCTDCTKLEEIARIESVSELKKFLKKHDLAALDREELRAAVNAFLDPDAENATPRKLDFFRELNLPDPDTLEKKILNQLGSVQPDLAASFGLTFIQGSFLTRERLIDDDVRDIIGQLRSQAKQWGRYADQKGIAL